MKFVGVLVLGIVLDCLYALLLALPVMWLTAYLADFGSPLAPLSYGQSWVVAFLLSWLVDGCGSPRRALEEATR